jgi:hypothetical protein
VSRVLTCLLAVFLLSVGCGEPGHPAGPVKADRQRTDPRPWDRAAALAGFREWGALEGAPGVLHLLLAQGKRGTSLLLVLPPATPRARAEAGFRRLADRMGWADAALSSRVSPGGALYLRAEIPKLASASSPGRLGLQLDPPALISALASIAAGPAVLAVRLPRADLITPSSQTVALAGVGFMLWVLIDLVIAWSAMTVASPSPGPISSAALLARLLMFSPLILVAVCVGTVAMGLVGSRIAQRRPAASGAAPPPPEVSAAVRDCCARLGRPVAHVELREGLPAEVVVVGDTAYIPEGLLPHLSPPQVAGLAAAAALARGGRSWDAAIGAVGCLVPAGIAAVLPWLLTARADPRVLLASSGGILLLALLALSAAMHLVGRQRGLPEPEADFRAARALPSPEWLVAALQVQEELRAKTRQEAHLDPENGGLPPRSERLRERLGLAAPIAGGGSPS